MKLSLSRALSWQPFTPAVFLGGCAIALVALAILAASYLHGQRQAAQTRVDAAMGGARSKSTSEAMETAERARDFQAQSEALSRENENAIRNAAGASAPISPDLNRAALERLCARRAYSGDPSCAMFQPRTR